MSESVDVVLVGCSSSKLATEAPARELYTSTLFKASRAYAEARGGPWAILSAKHGLVLPETYLAPYDYSFKSLRAEAGRAPKVARSVKGAVEDWGRTVQRELVRRWPGARFIFLAGADYAACLPTFSGSILDGRPARSAPIESVEPLRGMGIGERVAWLKRATECWTSELGSQRFEGDDVPARICEDCALHALKRTRALRRASEASS